MPREVITVSLIGFIVTLGFGVIGPSLPALGEEFGAGTTLMSVAISGFAVARLATNLAFTAFLDRWRLRTVLWTGLLLQSVCSVGAGLAPDYVGFIVLRSVSGVGSAAFTIASSALLLALAPDTARGRAMSVFAAATALGTVSGPAVGGLFAVIDPRLPLLVYGGALAAASLATLVLLRRAKDVTATRAEIAPESAAKARWPIVHALVSDRLFAAAVACQVVGGWVFYGMRTTTMPLDLAGLGYTVGTIGLLLSAGSVAQIIGSSGAGPLSDRRGRVLPIATGLVMTVGSLGAFVFAASPVAAILAFVLLGLAGGAVVSVSTAMLGDSRFGRTASGIGVYWVAMDAAAIVGPLVSGLVAEAAGFSSAYLVAGVLTAAAIVIVLRAGGGRGTRAHRDPSPDPSSPPAWG